jgi:hypothetical protein
MALRREIKVQPEDFGPIRYRLGPARIYLDDVELIYEALLAVADKKTEGSQDNKAASIIITAGDARADLPDDLRDARPEELQKVRIAIKDPAVSVDLFRRYAVVSAISSESGAKELAAGIRNSVNRRRSFWAVYYFWGSAEITVFSLSLILATLIITAAITLATAYALFSLAVIAAALVVILTAGGNCWFAYRLGAVRLIPRRESETRKNSSETRKQLMIALLGAIIGGLIVGLASLWAGVYVHH